MPATKLEQAALAQLIQKLCNNDVPDAFRIAPALIAYARRLNNYNETECNYGLTERQEARVRSIEQRVRALLPASVGIIFNGDPRGYAVKLLLPSGDYNTWGGKESGWGI